MVSFFGFVIFMIAIKVLCSILSSGDLSGSEDYNGVPSYLRSDEYNNNPWNDGV
jgi:hypothetical protein